MNNLYTSIEINGGLGNQLFQIAYIISFLRLSKGCRIKRKLIFKYKKTVSNSLELYRKSYWGTLLKGLFTTYDEATFEQISLNVIHEELIAHKYILPPRDIKNNILFKGNHQTFKFIDDSLRDKMIRIVYSNEDMMYPAYYKYRDILDYFGPTTKDDEIVSLHIRRGDYLLVSNYHYNLEMSYYKEAMEIAGKKNVVVFSDDIEWCINNFDKYVNRDNKYNVYYVTDKLFKDDELNIKPEIEFILMTMFKHNIIANSCFSLWASFISYYTKKIVIAPKRWYSCDGCKDYEEIYHKYITHII